MNDINDFNDIDNLESLLIEGKQKRKEELDASKEAYNEAHKEERAAYKKAYNEQKARELGFENYAQRVRYDRWCKKNNIGINIKNSEYLDKIQYCKENIDK